MKSCCIQLDQSSFDCLAKFSSDALQQVFKPRKKDDESGYMELPPDTLGTPLTAKLIQIFCSKEEGQQLLAIAQAHCTAGVFAIKDALNLADKDI
jgi:hypothetical protein